MEEPPSLLEPGDDVRILDDARMKLWTIPTREFQKYLQTQKLEIFKQLHNAMV